MNKIKIVLPVFAVILSVFSCKPEFKECVNTWKECKANCPGADLNDCLSNCSSLIPPNAPLHDKEAWAPFNNCLLKCSKCYEACDTELRACLGVEE